MTGYEYSCMPCMPYMQVAGVQNQCSPMIEMPQEELEDMYPKIYHIIYPHVKQHCDRLLAEAGPMCKPTHKELDDIIENICCKVEVDVDIAVKGSRESEERQLGFGGGRLLRNLIGILLIRELLGRRRVFGGFPGYYGGYAGYYNTYPGYFGGYPYYY